MLREGDIVQFAGHANVDIGKMLSSTKTDLNLRYRFSTHPPMDFTTPTTNRVTNDIKSRNHGDYHFSSIKNISTHKECSSAGNERGRCHGSSVNSNNGGKEKRSKTQSRMSEGSPLFSSISAASSARDTKKNDKNLQEVPTKDILNNSSRNSKLCNDTSGENISHIHSPLIIAATDTKLPISQPPAVAVTATTMLDLGTLKQKVSCTLCTQPFVDAVVARCSHGFCRACLEKHLQKGKSSCPICNSPPLKYYKRLAKKSITTASSSSSCIEGKPLFYHRSDHLDNIVFLLLETENDGGMELFKKREKDDHEYLRSVGIDPYSNPGLYEEDLDNRMKVGYTTKMGTGISSSERRRSRSINSSESNGLIGGNHDEGEYSEFSDDSEVMRRKKIRRNSGASSKKQLCEFCAGSDHEFPDCPHRDSESDSDDSSFSD